MSTGWMRTGLDATLNGDIDWDTDTIKCVMLLSSYSFSAAHEFLDDISASAAVNGTSSALTVTKTIGVIDVSNFTITPDTAQTIGSLMFYKDTGTPGTSNVLWFADSNKVSNLPLATDGSAVNITIDAGANKLFAITPVLT